MNIGSSTPWGRADFVTELLPGMVNVSTAKHGGIFVDQKRNEMIPAYMRRDDGWYEEDCDWCIPFCVFERELFANGNDASRKAIADQAHKDTLKNWHPAAYERFYVTVLTGKDSFIRSEEEFRAAHANDWVVYSCTTGTSFDPVPAGMVKCYAGLGMRGNQLPNPTRQFLVPLEEYATRNHFGFIIDPARHQELTQAVQS